MTGIIGTSLLVLLAGGVPIAFVMGGAGLIGLLLHPDGMALLLSLPEQIFNQLNSFPFLTIYSTSYLPGRSCRKGAYREKENLGQQGKDDLVIGVEPIHFGILVLMIITYVESFSMFLPRLLGVVN